MYLITATPRSGLNLISQCLNILGIRPLTHESTADANTINDLLLQDLGLSWYAPALPRNWQQTAAAEKAGTRISSLLQSGGFLDKQSDQARAETDSACHLTINNALTLDLWLQALKEFSIRPQLILMLRHPWETAQSLAANHNLDLQRGHILWLAHTRAALRAFEGMGTETEDSEANTLSSLAPCPLPLATVLTYDQLLADPISTLRDAFGSLLTSDFRSLTSDLLDFVTPSQKHHHASDLPEADREYFKPYAQLYDQILNIQHSSSAKISGDLRLKSSSSSLLSEPDLIDSLLKTLAQHDHSTDSSQPAYSPSGTTDRSLLPTTNRQATTGLFATITFTSSSTHGEVTKRIPLIEDQWQKIELPVPEPVHLRNKQLTIQPLNTYGTVSVASITLVNRATSLDYRQT